MATILWSQSLVQAYFDAYNNLLQLALVMQEDLGVVERIRFMGAT
jgi:hypothetical protein